MRTRGVKPGKPSLDEELFGDEQLASIFGSAENGRRLLGITAENIGQPELRSETVEHEELQEKQLGTAGMAAFCWLYKIARSACHESKIEAEHLPLVHALEKSQQANLTELAEKVGVHPTTVRRQMNALEKNGLATVRPGRLRKKKAMIPEIFAPGREELSRCRAKIGSELKVTLDSPTGQGEEFVEALERLLAISKGAPR